MKPIKFYFYSLASNAMNIDSITVASVVSGVTMIAPQVTLLMAVALQLQCLFSKSYLVNTAAKTEDSKDGPHHSAFKLTSSNKALPAYPTDALTRTLTKAIVKHVPGYQEGQEGFII